MTPKARSTQPFPRPESEEPVLHAAYLAARDAGLRPCQAAHVAEAYGAANFGAEDATDLRRRLQARHAAARAALRRDFPGYDAPSIRRFWRRVWKLRDEALEMVDQLQDGRLDLKELSDEVAHLRAKCPGFARETYERARADAWFSLR